MNLTKPPKTAKAVTNIIGCDKLELVRGKGYWYFTYDDPEANIWASKSIYTMYLSDMTLERWVQDGKDFVAEVETNKVK